MSPIERDLLLALTSEGAMTMYDLAKYDTKKHKIRRAGRIRHYPTVLRAMRRLKELELVTVAGHGVGKKGARTDLYDLTFAGLRQIMPALTLAEMRQASVKHHDLVPEIFDLWPTFSPETEIVAVERLKWFSTVPLTRSKWGMTDVFLNLTLAFRNKEWKKALSENENLRETTIRNLRLDLEHNLQKLPEIGLLSGQVELRPEILEALFSDVRASYDRLLEKLGVEGKKEDQQPT